MKKTDQEYLKLMLVIHTYSNFKEHFFEIINGQMDDDNAILILRSVEECFTHGIKDQSYQLVADSLVKEMIFQVKRIADAEPGKDEIKSN